MQLIVILHIPSHWYVIIITAGKNIGVYIYVKRKVWIRTNLGFCCANLGSELWRNNPRIAHANIGSEDLLRKPQIRGFAAQTSNPHTII